jgi:hypothetical protein
MLFSHATQLQLLNPLDTFLRPTKNVSAYGKSDITAMLRTAHSIGEEVPISSAGKRYPQAYCTE